MSVGEQTYQQRINEVFLPHNVAIHTHYNGIHKGTVAFYAFVQFSYIDTLTHKFLIIIRLIMCYISVIFTDLSMLLNNISVAKVVILT